MKNQWHLIVAFFLSVLIGALSPRWALGDEVGDKGRELIMSKGCIACHQINGKGGEVGPHLDGVSTRRSEEWIVQQLKDPKSHKADGKMPKPILTDAEIRQIASYLATLK